ncbi:MAG: hypothetical protein V3S55_07650 [Nitrospiraceae bacterium]
MKLPSAEELLDIIVKIMLAAREDGSVPSAQIGADACKYILSYRNAVLEVAAEVLRCIKTGHPCGTDTESPDYPCFCGVCAGWRAIRALKEDL